MSDSAIRLGDVHKRFGPTPIILGVNLDIARGQRHAIIGPNGAGKTTLFNLMSGRFPVSPGTIELNGRPIDGLAPHRINRLGLSRSFFRSPSAVAGAASVAGEVARPQRDECDLADQRHHRDVQEREPPSHGRHAAGAVEDPADHERTDEAAGKPAIECSASVAPRRLGSALPAAPAVSEDESSQMSRP